jgi:uncharacterized membrane protein YbaN (DUF454 family)
MSKICYPGLMHKAKKLFHLFLGLILIATGLLGLVLPILNGTLLLVLGFILISFESPYVEYHLSKLAHRNTFTGDWYEKLLAYMKKIFRN